VSRGTPDLRDVNCALRREVLAWVLTAVSAFFLALYFLGYIEP
jgi:hypothetical protein